ncbi:MAG: DUF4390 domain-containing protein [Dissulfurispiraceae bacterium]
MKTTRGVKLNFFPAFIRVKAQTAALLLLLTVIFFTLPAPESGLAAEITPVVANQIDNELFVTTTLQPDEKLVTDLGNGLSKELVFYVDLFRHWTIWPDEFVLGKKIIRVLKSDPIKREYIGSSTDGNIRTIKRFKDLESMISWAIDITNLKLTNVKALDPDEYYVKVTAESNLRKLPPVIGYLLFFTPNKEFSVSANSPLFKIPAMQEAR